MIEVCMSNEGVKEEFSYINSIRKNLQVIGNTLIGNNDCIRSQLNNVSKAQLINAIDSLEKEMDPLPDSYKHEINLIITAARFKLSYLENE
jgi:hypothetical protein